jgi:hypothetical protein
MSTLQKKDKSFFVKMAQPTPARAGALDCCMGWTGYRLISVAPGVGGYWLVGATKTG